MAFLDKLLISLLSQCLIYLGTYLGNLLIHLLLRYLKYLEEEDESSKEPQKPYLGWGKLTIEQNK